MSFPIIAKQIGQVCIVHLIESEVIVSILLDLTGAGWI